MSLPEDYMDYPKRRYGQDIGCYDWRPMNSRARTVLQNGKKLAVMPVVPVEFYPLNPPKSPFVHPRGMKTPYPDLRHYSTRDYGNRVGIYRLLKLLRAFDMSVTIPVSAALVKKAAPLISDIMSSGHEIAAAGLHTAAIHWGGIDPLTERDYVARTRDVFADAGIDPVTWMSPARQQSRQTLEMLAEFGFSNCLDWESDQVPVSATTPGGSVTLLPLHNELEDAKLILDRRQSEESWAAQIAETSDYLLSRYDEDGAQTFGFQITPFVMGQPFRVFAVEKVFAYLKETDAIWVATAKQITRAFSDAA